MRLIGHRGCPEHQPENTIAAVRTAAAHVDMVEVDVQRCKSGEIVVFHDDTLDRLTTASGPISEFTYDELSTLTVGDSDERIPTLREMIECLPSGTGLNVELKHAGMGPDVASLLGDFDEPLIVSSFEADALSAFRDEPIPTAYLFTYSFRAAIRRATELGCEYLHPYHRFTSERAIRRAHARGLRVNAWTVPSTSSVAKLREAGIDGVIVDSWETVPERKQPAY